MEKITNYGKWSRTGKRREDPVKARPLPESVLRLIWQEHRISRAEIARRFGLSRSTVTEIVKELLQTGFVMETGSGESRGGRRPIVLEFDDTARVILGIDIGADHVAAVMTDLRGRPLAWESRPHPVWEDPEGTITTAIELGDACLAARTGSAPPLLHVGVAVPSPVDPFHPDALPETIIPAWKGRNEFNRLHPHFGVPVHIDNDANLGALAEHRWGAGRGVDDMIYIKVAQGIGAGHILAGGIYRGAGGYAGEIGHMALDPEGDECMCGLRGCLVLLVGSAALETRAAELYAAKRPRRKPAAPPSIDAIEDDALAGDPIAIRVITEAAEHLGTAIVGWCNLMNPSMVILGGNLVRTGDILLTPLRKRVDTCTLVGAAAADIRGGDLGHQAIAIGAATLALEAALDQPSMLHADETGPLS